VGLRRCLEVSVNRVSRTKGLEMPDYFPIYTCHLANYTMIIVNNSTLAIGKESTLSYGQ